MSTFLDLATKAGRLRAIDYARRLVDQRRYDEAEALIDQLKRAQPIGNPGQGTWYKSAGGAVSLPRVRWSGFKSVTDVSRMQQAGGGAAFSSVALYGRNGYVEMDGELARCAPAGQDRYGFGLVRLSTSRRSVVVQERDL